jgi:integrase
MKRRGAGEGSIVKRSDGRWMARVDLGWVSGRRTRKSIYGKTRQEVARKLSAALRAHQDGLPLSDERVTVGSFLHDWLASARTTVRPRTWQTYESYVRLHAIPALGRVPLAKLEPKHLQRLYAEKLAAGLSPTTVHHLHAVLHRALAQATRWGMVPRNVAGLVDSPPMARHEMRTLNPDEAKAFLEAAAGDRLEALYVLALTTGMRQGELFRLRWQDVDLEAHTLSVRGETKTAKSRRQIELSEVAVDALRATPPTRAKNAKRRAPSGTRRAWCSPTRSAGRSHRRTSPSGRSGRCSSGPACHSSGFTISGIRRRRSCSARACIPRSYRRCWATPRSA